MADDKTVSVDEYTKVRQDYDREVERARRFEAELVDTKKKLEPFAKVDLERLRAAAEELENVKREKASGDPAQVKHLIEEGKKELRSEWQREREEQAGVIAKLQSENKELKVVDRVMNEIGADFNEDMHGFIKQIVRTNIDLGENGFFIKDDKGEVRYSSVDRAKPMSIKEFSAELQGRHPSIAKSRVVSGGMTGGQKRNGNVPTIDTNRYNRMSVEERSNIPTNERGKLAMDSLKGVSAVAFMRGK